MCHFAHGLCCSFQLLLVLLLPLQGIRAVLLRLLFAQHLLLQGQHLSLQPLQVLQQLLLLCWWLQGGQLLPLV